MFIQALQTDSILIVSIQSDSKHVKDQINWIYFLKTIAFRFENAFVDGWLIKLNEKETKQAENGMQNYCANSTIAEKNNEMESIFNQLITSHDHDIEIFRNFINVCAHSPATKIIN